MTDEKKADIKIKCLELAKLLVYNPAEVETKAKELYDWVVDPG